MKIIIPEEAVCAYLKRAWEARNADNELNECLAIFGGIVQGERGVVTDVILPRQDGDGGKVVDLGKIFLLCINIHKDIYFCKYFRHFRTRHIVMDIE